MSTFNLFKEEVICFYQQERSLGRLPIELENPSPAKLKSYILNSFHRGDLRADKDTLEKIFNAEGQYADLAKAIEKYGTDKLKALQYLMIGKTTESKESFVKLLAIAIDFQPRPFNKWREDYLAKTSSPTIQTTDLNTEDYPSGTEGNAVKEEPETGLQTPPDKPENINDEDPKTLEPPIKEKKGRLIKILLDPFLVGKHRFKLRAAVITILVSSLFTAVYYLTPKQCMCWVGDQYLAVACSDKTQANPVIAFNENVEGFKKIMRPDTLTAAFANRVWYSKINHEVEFFTSSGSGFHPICKNRGLKVATAYILEKYAGRNAKVSQTVSCADN